jgi:glycosyltransferase involved in cell wall biosynthesis
MGRPVVATDHGGSRETVQHETSGFLVPPGDPVALAQAIEHVLGLTPAERLALGGRARAFAEQHYSKARMCAATLGVYAELLGDTGAAPGTNPATNQGTEG